ncbi:hypothetical protein CAL29_03385 [Bordetella genomosp. 10]|uniref:Ferritin-like domain-containing protein n=1 Tax=Bordetella genomosp. 10 TaxID=1416804 RepID=A0A261SN88_9BORD|nr:ferritin-like domain-containing protein [Bordetella genomosp. 10]OZI38585.1 hypothetical protein CAL29_03385 [Bordetella genomosp. 10]
MPTSAPNTPDAPDARDVHACLLPPPARGWPRLQARLVDRIKRAALRRLHASQAGEVLLLRMYLIGEASTEQALQDEWTSQDSPAWLSRQAARHLEEERGHVRMFADAIAQRGGSTHTGEPDWLSRRKIARWKRLALRHAPHFSQGVLVPAYAIGLCAEQMGVRVLRRHCDTIGADHPLHPLLAGVLDDESRHVRLCMHTLTRIVATPELPRLEALLREIRGIERGFGISGSIGMYLAGWLCAWRSRPAADAMRTPERDPHR